MSGEKGYENARTPLVLREFELLPGCPKFRVEARPEGDVNLFGLSGCAIPGEYRFRVPEAAFFAFLRGFEQAHFFSVLRLDPRYGGADAAVKAGRPLPAISKLEETFREITPVKKYLAPNLDLYRELVKSGWNANTLGEDHENALAPAVLASDSASAAFLLQHGVSLKAERPL